MYSLWFARSVYWKTHIFDKTFTLGTQVYCDNLAQGAIFGWCRQGQVKLGQTALHVNYAFFTHSRLFLALTQFQAAYDFGGLRSQMYK